MNKTIMEYDVAANAGEQTTSGRTAFLKKPLAFLLALVMLLSLALSSTTVAYAADATYFENKLAFGVTQSGQGATGIFQCYSFTLDSYTTMKIDYDAIRRDSNYEQKLFVIKAKDFPDWKLGKSVSSYFTAVTDYSGNNFWYDGNMSLYAGSYFLIIADAYGSSHLFDYSFSVTPTVTALRGITKTSTATSTTIRWTGDLGATGYQLQKKTSGSYKTIANTIQSSYTVKNLTPATSYSYRVRGYVTVDGKRYYGPWKTFTAVTKPSKVTINTPTTNTKHQITAKWSAVKGATGYQVQFGKNKSFSSIAASKTVSGQSTISATCKNLTKDKTYYVRVRAYKVVNDTKYYGAWSAVKSIKCK